MLDGNGRPINKKKQVQFLVALTLLAWATETLRHQWALGSERTEVQLQADTPRRIALPQLTPSGDSDEAVAPAQAPVESKEQFPTAACGLASFGTLELRSDATIVGAEIKLKQICRWTAADQNVFAPLADFVISRFKPDAAAAVISITDVRKTLQDAGVNMAAIDFAGASACKITRSDAGNDQRPALDDWIAARSAAAGAVTTGAVTASASMPPADGVWNGAPAKGVNVTSASPPTTAPAMPGSMSDDKQFHTLREKLIADLALRTKVTPESLEMEFRPQDEKVLVLSEPQFQFDIQPVRVRNLGDVTWNVTILADGGSQKLTIDAVARAWQNQLVIVKPIASRQVIRDEDCVERRVMADTLSDEPLLTRSQLVGQQAARDLSPATVMTARMVEAVPMVRSGEFVTITLTQGSVQIKTVGRAMESGAFGQSIRVRNEATRDIYQVTMDGPQTATMEGSSFPK